MIGHPLSDTEMPFGKLLDCGMVEYREFACSRRTFEWLRDGAMRRLDGEPVTLTVACDAGPNVIVKAVTPSWWAEPSYVRETTAPSERMPVCQS